MAKSVFTDEEISEDNPYASLGSGVGFSNPYARRYGSSRASRAIHGRTSSVLRRKS